MSYENLPFAPLGDPLAERRTQALEKQATAQDKTATQAERAADAMSQAAGTAGYAQRRAELLALVNTAMSARLAQDISGAVALAVNTLAAVDDALPEPTEPPPDGGQ
jgi:hypothetical protein